MFRIIGAANGWGARKHATEDGPIFLKKKAPNWPWAAIISPKYSYHEKLIVDAEERLHIIADFNTRLAQRFARSVRHGNTPVVIGGDHSIAMGTWSGVTAELGAEDHFGLIWIDAHMDAHTLESSGSGNIHGMPVAHLIGRGENLLRHIRSTKRKIHPKHVVLLGIRSYEPEEIERLRRFGVTIYSMEDIKRRGFDICAEEAMRIANLGTRGFGVSLDIDALDPEDAPATGCYEPGGIRATEILKFFKNIKDNPKLKALEIAEYNPHLDATDNRTFTFISKLINGLLTIK